MKIRESIDIIEQSLDEQYDDLVNELASRLENIIRDTINQVAQKHNMSTSDLINHFKEVTGMSPESWCDLSQRPEQRKNALMSLRKEMSDWATSSGFPK